MTNDDAIALVDRVIENGIMEADSLYTYDFWYVIQEALEKAERYKWHDLRKNPTDLPKDRKGKLTIVIGKENYARYEVLKYNDHKLPFEDNPIGWSRNDAYGCDVIAWRDIEPLEVVTNE